MQNLNSRPNGFTLLELLVAVAILALIAVGAYRLLSDTVMVREQGQKHQQALRDLQKALTVLQRDLQQTAPRPVRDEFGDIQPALYLPQSNVLEFTRGGWRNPLQQARSDRVRLRYRVENGELLRERWDVLDRARQTQPQKTVLLEGVSEFSVRVFADGNRAESWPPLTKNTTDRSKVPLPQAVEMSFRHPTWGNIQRIIPLPQGDENAAPSQD